MIRVYINYPISHISIHSDPNCSRIMQAHKMNQRHIMVDQHNAEMIFKKFREKDYRFSSNSDFNDMWLDISLSSMEDELSFIGTVKRELGKHYKPFKMAKLSEHC